MLDIRTTMSVHPGLTLGAITAMVGARLYLLFGKWQRSSRRIAAAEERAARDRGSGEAARDSISVWQHTLRGARFTAMFPGVFAIPLLLIGVFGGRYQIEHGTMTDYFELALVYFLGSVLVGAIKGYGMSLTRGAAGRAIVGMIAVAPWLSGIAYAGDSNHLSGFDAACVAGLSVVLGIAMAYGATRADRWRLARGQ